MAQVIAHLNLQENLYEVPDSRLQPAWALAIAVIWRVNQWVEELSPSLYVIIKKLKKKRNETNSSFSLFYPRSFISKGNYLCKWFCQSWFHVLRKAFNKCWNELVHWWMIHVFLIPLRLKHITCLLPSFHVGIQFNDNMSTKQILAFDDWMVGQSFSTDMKARFDLWRKFRGMCACVTELRGRAHSSEYLGRHQPAQGIATQFWFPCFTSEPPFMGVGTRGAVKASSGAQPHLQGRESPWQWSRQVSSDT